MGLALMESALLIFIASSAFGYVSLLKV